MTSCRVGLPVVCLNSRSGVSEDDVSPSSPCSTTSTSDYANHLREQQQLLQQQQLQQQLQRHESSSADHDGGGGGGDVNVIDINDVDDDEDAGVDTSGGFDQGGGDDDICDVCRGAASYADNQIVFCDGCNVAVHQACYGIDNIPEGDWFCAPCSRAQVGTRWCVHPHSVEF